MGVSRLSKHHKQGYVVLFLDEFPQFATDIIESLRQPLESGEVTIARGDETATYPARGMVVFACNPCPCGQFSGRGRSCECGPVERRNYRKRMSGPILDRIDITRHVEPTGPIDRDPRVASPESSERVRARVTAARLRQLQRYEGRPWRTNGQAPGALLERHWPMERQA